MLSFIICYLLTSVGFYLILAYFLQSKAKLKSSKKLKKTKVNTKYFLYYNLIYYKNRTKENVINDYILYTVNKPIVIKDFKYFNIDINLDLNKIFLLKVNNVFDIDYYKQFYSNFYNLNKKGINFIFLCKTDLIYNNIVEELMFNVFKIYNVKNISYSLFSLLNKVNKNELFLPISEINNKNVNINNSYKYTVKNLNIKKFIFNNKNICDINNKTVYPKLINQKFYLEYNLNNLNFSDKIYKSYGTNHFINYSNDKKCKYTFSYYLGDKYNVYKIVKYKGIKIYAYEKNLKKEILVLHLNFLKRFKYNLVYYYYNNKLYYYVLITINLKNENLYINNFTINKNEKIFKEKVCYIKEFFNNNITNINYINNFYNDYLKQKILKNLVTLEKYYNINYLKEFNNLNFEDSFQLNKIDNKIIKSVIENYNIENFIKLSKLIDPCILLYVINKIHHLVKSFKSQKNLQIG